MGCKNKRRKMFLGGVDPISLATGALSIVQGISNNMKVKNQERATQEQARQQQVQIDREQLDDFNVNGIGKSFYRTGGVAKLNARKGLLPLNSEGNVLSVVGPKHSQGGVDIGNIEAEGGEVVKIDGNNLKVLSDATNVFGYSPADNAKVTGNFDSEFNKQETIKMKKGINSKDNKAALGLNTTLQYPNKFKSLTGTYDPLHPYSYDQALNSSKMQSNVNNPIIDNSNSNGLNADRINQSIDNVANLALTALTPKNPKPILQPRIKMNTNVDVNPMLEDINNQQRAVDISTDRNISDANVAAAIKSSAGNTALSSRLGVRGNQLNAENQLKNQETQLNANITSNNTATLNRSAENNMARGMGINSALSANLANLQQDLTVARNNKVSEKLDNDRLLTQLLSDTDGNLANAILVSDTFDDTIKGRYNDIISSPYINQKLKDTIIRKYQTINK